MDIIRFRDNSTQIKKTKIKTITKIQHSGINFHRNADEKKNRFRLNIY